MGLSNKGDKMTEIELKKAYELLTKTAYISNGVIENMGYNEFKEKMKWKTQLEQFTQLSVSESHYFH